CIAADGGTVAEIRVSDPGVGIPEADLPRIFERFQRGSNVERIPGTGIGLAGARQIVEQHGGTISVESDEGSGSTFTVHLPIEPARMDRSRAGDEEAASSEAARIRTA